MTYILGISSFYHDSAAALIKNGEIIAAAQEERFTRIKHDSEFPINAIKYVLNESRIELNEVRNVVFYEKPFLKFERLLETFVAKAPKGFNLFRKAIPIWIREKLFQKSLIINQLKLLDRNFNKDKIFFAEHHMSHAASAFYPSPYREALILTLDGVGEWSTSTISIGRDNKIEIIKEILFPHSLGLLYSAFTYYLGFKVNSGEYKVMGLAPYGEPKYKKLIIENLIDIKSDGSFFLDQNYFNYLTGLTMTNKKFSLLFGAPARKSENELLTQFHMDVAASVQSVIEEVVLKIARFIKEQYKISNLCLAGGVALNCVANSKILNSNIFENIWIQPAAGDAGGALGGALLAWYQELGNQRKINSPDSMKGSFLGPQYDDESIELTLKKIGATFSVVSEELIIKKTSSELLKGKAIGWFQGRMEFGPRALGSRSIIADPRSEKMQKILNLKVKYRESFRPFAPSVLVEEVNSWFDLEKESPYMLFVADVKKNHCYEMSKDNEKLFGIEKLNIKRSSIPAVTHVDYSARVQTVSKKTNYKYYNLISQFNRDSGCPIIVNTSFNVRGEPIVCTPEDAFRCFMGTELDVLVIGNCFLLKNDQDKKLIEDYKVKYELD